MNCHALVLRTIIRHQPCTKLCVKQHSGLSMSTVLSAVDALAKAGWIDLSARAAPRGGKPHARIEASRRVLYGAQSTPQGVVVKSISLQGEITAVDLPAEGLDPLYAIGECPWANAHRVAYPKGVACYLACHGGEAYLHDDLHLYRAAGEPIDLSSLPSPMWQGKRLSFGEAYRVGTEAQKNRLTAELTVWLHTLLGIREISTHRDVRLDAADAACWAGLYHLLYDYLW